MKNIEVCGIKELDEKSKNFKPDLIIFAKSNFHYAMEFNKTIPHIIIPISDCKPIRQDFFEYLTHFTLPFERILIVCEVGASRSVSLALFLEMKHNKLSFVEAWNKIMSKRSIMEPHPILINSIIKYFGVN